jgi:hypothetical protein
LSTRKLIALLASIGLVLVLVLTGCGQATTTPSAPTTPATPQVVTKTVEVEESIQAESPRGIALPVQIIPLATRLDTLDGKVIYIDQGEADPIIFPALAQALPAKYPKTTWVYYNPSSGFGPTTPEDAVLGKAEGFPKADAVIRGNAW